MRMKIFYTVVLYACLFIACEKDNDDNELIKPPVEEPDKPIIPPPSTTNIIKIRIGDLNMIVGSKQWNAVAYGNGKYVVVGDSGLTTTSTDGVTWTEPEEIRNESGYIVWSNLYGVCAVH